MSAVRSPTLYPSSSSLRISVARPTEGRKKEHNAWERSSLFARFSCCCRGRFRNINCPIVDRIWHVEEITISLFSRGICILGKTLFSLKYLVFSVDVWRTRSDANWYQGCLYSWPILTQLQEDQWHYTGIEIPAPPASQIDNHSVTSSLELLCASQNAKTTVSRLILEKSARKMHARPENWTVA